jgi:hypothetical protein
MGDFLSQAIERVKKKFVDETFHFLSEIEKPKSFKVISDYPPINNIELEIERGEQCFKFKAPSINLVKNIIQYQHDDYGFNRSFTLKSEKETMRLPKGAITTKINILNELSVEGEIWVIESDFNLSVKQFHRAIIPKKTNTLKDHGFFIHSEHYSDGNSLIFNGLTEFNSCGTLFHLFKFRKDEEEFLFIDALTPLLYIEFKRVVDSITYCLGTITGHLNRNEMSVIQSESTDFKKINGFKFQRLEDSVLTNLEAISPRIFSELTRLNPDVGHISTQVFSNLVTKTATDERFLRGLKIITAANDYPLEIRASAYSVALETIKNIIIEEHQEKVNPFKEKKFARELIKELKQIVKQVEESKFNNKKAVMGRLEQLNQVTNKDSFKIAFDLCGIKLNEFDEEALLKRNDFLHGRIPFENEYGMEQNNELRFITFKLHFLVMALILKYSGFDGFLLNNVKYFSLYNQEMGEIKEPLFRKI